MKLKNVPRARHVVLAAILVCLAPLPTAAEDYYVNITTDTNDGDCSPLGCSLRDAVMSANAHPGADTIHVPPGDYQLTITGINEDFASTGDLDISDTVNIFGSDVETTIIDAVGNDRVFDIMGAQAVFLFNLTIRGGNAGPSQNFPRGGGLQNAGSSFVLFSECCIEANQASESGGGIHNTRGTVRVLSSIIRGNQSAYGSAVYSGFNQSGTVIINRSTIMDNLATDTVTGQGGAIHVYQSAGLQITNSTISGNETLMAGRPGGVEISQDTAVISHCTLADNDGDDIYLDNPTPGAVILRNSIIRGSCGGDATSTEGGNIEGPGDTCGLVNPGDYFGVPVLLLPLGDHGGNTPTMPPQSLQGNPIIDNAWAVANCEQADQRGIVRPKDGDGDQVAICDSGATEVFYFGLPFSDGFESGDTVAWSETVP